MYLIYKILKELRYIMRSKSMRRLITLALLIVLLSMLCSRVFAVITVNVDGEDLVLPDFPDDIKQYYCILHYSGGQTNLLTADYPFVVKNNYSGGLIFYVSYYQSPTSVKFMGYTYDSTRNLWYFPQEYSSGVGFSNTSVDNFILSNSNIKNEKGNVVFYETIGEYLFDYSVYTAPTEQTEGSVKIYTNWLHSSYIDNYSAHVVTSPNTEQSLNIEMSTEINPENSSLFRYYFDATSNGDYNVVISFVKDDYKDIKVKELTISNIITQSGGNEGRRYRRTAERVAKVERQEDRQQIQIIHKISII